MWELLSGARMFESCVGISEKAMHFLHFDISGTDISEKKKGNKTKNLLLETFLAVPLTLTQQVSQSHFHFSSFESLQKYQ